MPEKPPMLGIAKEFEGAPLRDARHVRRVIATAEHALAAADRTLPEKLDAPGALQGAYRLFRNPRVQPDALLAPHLAQTVTRARAHPVVLVVHDTTELRFGGDAPRKGLGPLSDRGQGFKAHVAFAVTPEGVPLGILNLWAWRRAHVAPGAPPRRERRMCLPAGYDPDREYLRWLDGVDVTEEHLAGHPKVVHVMDREGDCFEVFAWVRDHGAGFVIRLCHDRRLDAKRRDLAVAKLFAALSTSAVRFTCDVAFGARPASSDEGHRTARKATLEVRAGTFVVSPSNAAVYHLPERMTLNFVEVREIDPPAGEAPILWRLVTTEPIDTDAQVAAVITVYQRRWIIEEFFKVLKTGCRYEDLQLRSGHALLNALCLLLPVAWCLLHLRWLERAQPETAASEVLTATQIEVLVRHQQHRPTPLPRHPTVRQALWAIAGLGGHLTHNGAPGVLTLLRGFRTLRRMEEAVLAFTGQVPQKM